MNKKFVGLIILDGFGLTKKDYGNAVLRANPKNINYYLSHYPHTKLEASGTAVGLTKGQIGNSEVGHLNIGAGRVVLQSLLKIDEAIKDKSFYTNPAFIEVFKHVKQNKSKLHIMGLMSKGGVHSHINHLYALLKACKMNNIREVYIHAFMDGRDTYRESGINEITKLNDYLQTNTTYKIATVMGRFYPMDREQNYDRIYLAYNAMVNGISDKYSDSPEAAILESYKNKVYDEFIKPVVITENGKPITEIEDGDGIINFNYREDRGRQITKSIMEPNFHEFKRKDLKDVKMVTFTRYDKSFVNEIVAFDKDDISINLSSVISKQGLKQFKIAETTKYAHVTYFLNGGIEKPYKNEERFLIETIKTEEYDKTPKMRAIEITEKAIKEINTLKYSFMALNYSNCDMIGHTGNIDAAVVAIKTIDEELKKLVDSILKINGIAIITADHGNAEQMRDRYGKVITDHTTNKVPFIIVGNNVDDIKLYNSGALSNIAPTILKLLNIEKPKEFSKNSLIKERSIKKSK